MDLSVIVPVYQVEKYVRPCMESVFKQRIDDNRFEVIIINDGTKDKSMEMIADIINQHKNITVINQENQGLSVARNNGIAAAKGEYILMLDSDDLLVENSLKQLVEKAIETKADMVIADFLKKNDKEILNIYNSPIKQPHFEMYEKKGEQYFMEDFLPAECYVWRSLFRRAFLIKNNLSFYPGIFFQDIPFTHECYLKANKCIRVSILLNIYRRGHDNTATALSSFSAKKARDLCIAITKIWELSRLNNISPALRKKMESNIHVIYLNLCFRILYFLNTHEEAIQTLKFLNKQAPDLRFTNNFSQRIGDFLRRKMPYIYLKYLSFKWNYHHQSIVNK